MTGANPGTVLKTDHALRYRKLFEPAVTTRILPVAAAPARAVLGHYLFVYIHPYMDGNGRMGRFLMNAMLAAAGAPWTVVRLQQRDTYMAALNSASGQGNITPFAEFIKACTQSVVTG